MKTFGASAPLEGASTEVRFRTRTGRRCCQGAAGQAMSDGVEDGHSSPLGATPTVADEACPPEPWRRRASTSVSSRKTQRESSCCSSIVSTTLQPARTIRLDPSANRTYHYWHVFVPNVQPGQLYGYRVDGPFDPASGMRFDPDKVLLDPYGRGVVVPRELQSRRGAPAGRQHRDRDEERRRRRLRVRLGRRRAASAPVLANHRVRDARARLHASSQLWRLPETTRGTFAGLIEKIPYLQQLGITAVELLPVFQFDPQDCSARTGELLGLCTGLVLRASPGLQLTPRSARSGRRVSRHGQGAAPGGHRGHSGRRVQPHRRRRPSRAHTELPRAGQPDLLHSRSGSRRATPITAAPATR